MNRIVSSGVLLTVLAGAALAQEPPNPPASGEPPMANEQATQPPSQPSGPQAGEDRDRRPYYRDGDRRHLARGYFGFRGHRTSKAAYFSIDDGNTKIDIKCADDEPTKVCADLLLQILDKLSSPSRL
jgi:hypothetical protein